MPENHVGARQIFPILVHPQMRTPTIKHHCPRVSVASCQRARSNTVGPDPQVLEEFKTYFREIIIPEFVEYFNRREHKISLCTWLESGRYNKAYQKKLLRAMVDRDITSEQWFEYKAMTKIELQFTPCLLDDKNTPLNDVKERQICMPHDYKKIMANPFINELEGVAHEFIHEYCGRKNWLQICSTIEKKMFDLPGLILGAADGSGFDMSQLPEFNKLMNELIMSCARASTTVFEEPLDVDLVFQALEKSLLLKVRMDNGIRYTAYGRASGDGWTTFGNTMLMRAYWKFVFYKAKIKDYLLLVKGDDVLLGLEPRHKLEFLVQFNKVFTCDKKPKLHGLGQICKKIDFGPIEDLDFLSCHFFWTKEERLRMTRIPARVIQSNSWSTRLPKNYTGEQLVQARKELCYSKGMCLLSWAKGLPIFEVLGKKMVELGCSGRLSEFNEYADGARIWHSRDDYDAYLQYLEYRYAMSVEEVRATELIISRISTLDGLVQIPALDKLYIGL